MTAPVPGSGRSAYTGEAFRSSRVCAAPKVSGIPPELFEKGTR